MSASYTGAILELRANVTVKPLHVMEGARLQQLSVIINVLTFVQFPNYYESKTRLARCKISGIRSAAARAELCP